MWGQSCIQFAMRKFREEIFCHYQIDDDDDDDDDDSFGY